MPHAPGPVPSSLLPTIPLDYRAADDTWSAVTAPGDWGAQADALLGDRGGAVIADDVRRTLTWIVPPGSADDWPDGGTSGVHVHRTGDSVSVPSVTGRYDALTYWRRPPSATRVFTAADHLRDAVERTIGPLLDARVLPPVRVCHRCSGARRDVVVAEVFESVTGPGYVWWTCRPCAGAPAARA